MPSQGASRRTAERRSRCRGLSRKRRTANTAIAISTAREKRVLEKAERGCVTDDRDGEMSGEQIAVGLDDREDKDEKAPEREGVGETGHRPVQQPLLTDDFSQLYPEAASELASRGRPR